MIEVIFKKLPRGTQRAVVGEVEFDVWAIGEVDGCRARWTALNTNTGRYIGGGLVKDVEVAKKLIDQFI